MQAMAATAYRSIEFTEQHILILIPESLKYRLITSVDNRTNFGEIGEQPRYNNNEHTATPAYTCSINKTNKANRTNL
jgi:hypothetical protein